MYPRSSRQVPLGAIVILSEAKDPWPEPRGPMSPREYYVYIMANVARTLYVGVTGDLYRRVAQHQDGSGSGFTARYHLNRLVYAEATQDGSAALLWEKQLKGGRRSRKLELIEALNSEWRDRSPEPKRRILSAEWRG